MILAFGLQIAYILCMHVIIAFRREVDRASYMNLAQLILNFEFECEHCMERNK